MRRNHLSIRVNPADRVIAAVIFFFVGCLSSICGGVVRADVAMEDLPNLIQNPGFEDGLKNWNWDGYARLEDIAIVDVPGGKALKITNSNNKNIGVYQNVYFPQIETRTLYLRYKVKVDSMSSGALVTYHVGVRYADGTTGWFTGALQARAQDKEWAVKEQIIYPSQRYTCVSIYGLSYYKTAISYFDDMELKLFQETPTGTTIHETLQEDTVLQGRLRQTTQSNPTSLQYMLIKPPDSGIVTLNNDGTYTYTPAANYFGQDTFYYKPKDGATDATINVVSLVIQPVNDPPVLLPIPYLTSTDVGKKITLRIKAKDGEGDTITYHMLGEEIEGAVLDEQTGSFYWTPQKAGTYNVSFFANDGQIDSLSAQVTLTVRPEDPLPAGINLIQNPGFENGLANWQKTGSGTVKIAPTDKGQSLLFENTDGLKPYVWQQITLSQPLLYPTIYFRVKVKPVRLGPKAYVRCILEFLYTDKSKEQGMIAVDQTDLGVWKSGSLVKFPSKEVAGVTIYLESYDDLSSVYYDELDLRVVNSPAGDGAVIEKQVQSDEVFEYALAQVFGKDFVPNQDAFIHECWSVYENTYTQQIAPRLQEGDTYQIYNIQNGTTDYLEYAYLKHDNAFIDKILKLYLGPSQCLETNARGDIQWIYRYENNAELQSLFGREHMLSSSQFMYIVSRALRLISEIPPSEQTQTMKTFVTVYAPVAVNYYNRWIPQVKTEFSNKLQTGPSFKVSSNGVADGGMWILAGAAELLVSRKQMLSDPVLSLQQQKDFGDFISLGCQLLESRLMPLQLTDFEGKSVQGFNFDLGMYDEHPEYIYSGYTGSTFPGWADAAHKEAAMEPMRAQNVGWDISHGRRFVNVFNTLYDLKERLGLSFPSHTVMVGLTNQFVYQVFNKDFNNPLFTNYMDGTNGWYRVNYVNRPGFGYCPSYFSVFAPAMGYGFWTRFNPDMMKLLSATYDLICGRGDTAIVQKWRSLSGEDGFKPSASLGMRLCPFLIEQLPARYHCENLPPGAVFDEVTANLRWIPSVGQIGTHRVELHASNDFLDRTQTLDIVVSGPINPIGDVSGNGQIMAEDAWLVARYLVGLIPDAQISGLCNGLTVEEFRRRGDVDGNPGLSANDAMLIAKRAVGLIEKFPVEG